MEATVESTYTRNKQQSLQRVNLRLEVARHILRLSHEFQAISTRSYLHGARLMDDLGRQLGGWLRSLSGETSIP